MSKSIKTKISLKCIVVDKESDLYLVLRRAEGDVSRPGAWDVCGGSMELEDLPEVDYMGDGGEGDLLLKVLQREVFEEIGLEVESLGLVNVVSGYKASKERLLIGLLYKGYVSNVEKIKLSDEHDHFRLVDKESFRNLEFGKSWTSNAIFSYFTKSTTKV